MSITQTDLERIVFDETADPTALPLSLLKEITDGFSDKLEIGRGGFSVVYKVEFRLSRYYHILTMTDQIKFR